MNRFASFKGCFFLSLPLAFTLSSAAPAFAPAANTLTRLAKLPSAVVESSGLELADEPHTYWTHNDAGNAPVLYKINEKGKLLQEIAVPGATNIDWEDLARDTQGNLYIGDMGNNSNKRQNLRIYKVALKNGFKPQEINFTYSDLPAGKIPKEARNFDCEAFFWANGKLYLISKDRGAGRYAKLYELSDDAGTHTAKLLGKKELPGMVTSADLSPDGKHLAVLSYGKLYLFPTSKGVGQFLTQTPKVLELIEGGQAEAVLFKDNKNLIITNEEGNLFKFSL
ncbi:hypothetical protein ACD591_15765 [Rufibacter glacialis]|uniref:Esterase-like activity of phytase family protein n=1 Tax=Rufibacter glacialis TaxID=1259555 RepID=A0A5M8QTS4_9BACT|nr:hypothetical protein [Rufibacter glacialis]KAA6437592.1 hypothetical protein FOE74_03575 [Rufibacter glacialis]GGK58050.1 hypothetical protein GCM10011405_02610 [Rufibacter glacialis]